MKYKIGDKVRVRNDLSVDKSYGGTRFDSQMTKFIGKVITIAQCDSVDNRCVYNIEEDKCRAKLYWTEEMFESNKLEFTKSDLKDGMVVEYRDGGRALVLGDWLFDETSCLLIENFNDNFENCYDGKNSVDKVYTSNAHSLSEYFDNNMLKLIWKRNPVKKMTIAEIEKELGYKIEIVSDKEE